MSTNIVHAFGFPTKYGSTVEQFPLLRVNQYREKGEALEHAKSLEEKNQEGVVAMEYDEEFDYNAFVVYAR